MSSLLAFLLLLISTLIRRTSKIKSRIGAFIIQSSSPSLQFAWRFFSLFVTTERTCADQTLPKSPPWVHTCLECLEMCSLSSLLQGIGGDAILMRLCTPVPCRTLCTQKESSYVHRHNHIAFFAMFYQCTHGHLWNATQRNLSAIVPMTASK